MILDREVHVAQGLALAGTGALLATDKIDLGPARDFGAGTPLWFYHNIQGTLAGGTTLEFELVTSSDATFATGVEVIGSTGKIALADIALPYLTFQPVARVSGVGRKAKRYTTIRVQREGTFAGTALWSSGITLSPDDYRQHYAATYTA